MTMTNDELDALEKRQLQEAAQQLYALLGYPTDSVTTGIGVLAKELSSLRRRLAEKEAERDTWKACALDIKSERDNAIRDAASLQSQLTAERERAEKAERDAKLLAQNNLDWFNQLKTDFDTAIRQRDTLKEALEPFAEHAKTVDSECVEDPDDTIICGFNGNYLRIGDIRRAQAALASLDQPANAAEGEKRG
jgi:uncharacterized protein YfcZ (UPF0381/DUF406 family)